MSLFNKTLAIAALALTAALAQASGGVQLDRAPLRFDNASLQSGAKTFVNYCLNCHGASALRYNRLTQIGLTEQQIKDNLMFTADKIGEQMKVAIRSDDAKRWFGAAPPDLSVIARARASGDGSGADWLYTYLRQFYRDDSRPTGWNNVIFPGVGMPHALWNLQGVQEARFVEKDDGHGNKVKHLEGLELVQPGLLTKEEYDEEVANLVSFLTWMGEPAQETRRQLGWAVLAVLGVLAVLSWMLKKAFWKDVH
ncbi:MULTISPECIES: cytochrome c1 [Uliginosibacterium]|uniref:Cytochrome c1 n=1 Tax=Uliginosibacterium aquaticum TaxID=2731212 RepID=A0ABX2IN15_9RHOO|nr:MULTISPECIES: cytochrome c1 [Uliginosibacterium]MDO6387348.1 cytochrome c1 [Uliginosibacterium sp. 31-12]NSL56397.1 cytochrome c1 [Uliginosibacterium aquaticum]PLK47150.1 cytochrome c1 [Uliginosibacterium sp. TH139]